MNQELACGLEDVEPLAFVLAGQPGHLQRGSAGTCL